MTNKQQQALRAHLTSLESAFQAYKNAVLQFLSGDHDAVSSPLREETWQMIDKHKATLVQHVLAMKLPTPRQTRGGHSSIKRRGFGSMDKARLRLLTSLAGKRAHATGKAHTFSREEAQRAGRIGGKGRRGKTAQSTD